MFTVSITSETPATTLVYLNGMYETNGDGTLASPLVSTACANGLNPYRYLEFLFNRFNKFEPSELLAWNTDLLELCK